MEGKAAVGRKPRRLAVSHPAKTASGRGNEREKEGTGNTGWADMRGDLRFLALRNARVLLRQGWILRHRKPHARVGKSIVGETMVELFYAVLIVGQFAGWIYFVPASGRYDEAIWNHCLFRDCPN